MAVLVLSHREVQELLSVEECIEVQARALVALAEGRVPQPLRSAVVAPGAGGVLGLMPSYWSSPHGGLYGLKSVCVFPGNSALGKDIHQGAVLLFSGETGELLSLMDASAITAIRTAAVSAVATRLLARQDAGDLAIIGAGVQARVHIGAIACVRTIRRARVASRGLESATKFADEMGKKTGLDIEPVGSVEAAIENADLIVTATTSREPVIKRNWISA